MTDAQKLKAALVAVFLCMAAGAGRAADVRDTLKALFPVPSSTGSEQLLAEKIATSLPKNLSTERDGLGGIVVRLGKSGAETLVLAALDGYGYIVSGMTDDGYLRLDRPVAAPFARFDAFLLGKPVIISTRKGLVQGVVAQPAIHLLTPERRKSLVEEFSLEAAFVDIGVRSAAEAKAKGVELLDAVTFMPQLTELAGDQWAGAGLGFKAGCAVLAGLAGTISAGPEPGGIVLAWAAQTKALARGRGARPSLGAARMKNLLRPRRIILIDTVQAGGLIAPIIGAGPVLIKAKESPPLLAGEIERAAAAAGLPLQSGAWAESPLATAFSDEGTEAVVLAIPVQFLNTPSEIVAMKDLEALGGILAALSKTGGAK